MIMRIIFLFFLFISCVNDPNVIQDFALTEELPIESITDAELIQTQQGVVKLRILAGSMIRYSNVDSLLHLCDIVVTFYNNKQKSSVLAANNASIDEKKKIMTASGNVVLENKKNKLETEKLIWDERSQKIYTEEQVKITNQEETIFGEGFSSNADFTEYKISKIHGNLDISF